MSAADCAELSIQDKEPAKQNGRGIKPPILVVEDNEMVRRLVTKILQLSGYRVLEAAHGVEALQLCQKHDGEIKLMITDLLMPGMDGRELAEQMRKRRPEMSVLFISGYADDPSTRKMLGEGREFLSKPFLPKTLLKKIGEMLEKSSASDQLSVCYG